jgi:hypothetical protein
MKILLRMARSSMRKLITAILLMGARHLLAFLENGGPDTASCSNRSHASIALSIYLGSRFEPLGVCIGGKVQHTAATTSCPVVQLLRAIGLLTFQCRKDTKKATTWGVGTFVLRSKLGRLLRSDSFLT